MMGSLSTEQENISMILLSLLSIISGCGIGFSIRWMMTEVKHPEPLNWAEFRKSGKNVKYPARQA